MFHGVRFWSPTPPRAERHDSWYVILAPHSPNAQSWLWWLLTGVHSSRSFWQTLRRRQKWTKAIDNLKVCSCQREDAHCRHLVKKAYTTDSPFLYEELGILPRLAWLDGAIRKIIALFPTKEGMKQKHNSTISGHLRVRRMLDAMRRFYYWPHMVDSVYNYVERRPVCPKHCHHSIHQRYYNCFYGKGRSNLLQ